MIHLWILLLCCRHIYGAHFEGGMITWKPLDPYTNSTLVPISIQQYYWWQYPLIKCAKNVPTSTSGRSGEVSKVLCVADCSTDGGYSTSPINTLTDCIQVSSSLGMMTSQRTVNKTLTSGAHFYLAYVGNAWTSLGSPAKTGLEWSILTFIDLRLRPDGFINTPPVASIVSPQYVIVNRTTQMKIAVSDVNIGDDVRCRWSSYTAGSRRRRQAHENFYVNSTANNYTELVPVPNEETLLNRMKRLFCFLTSCSVSCCNGCPCTSSACLGTTCTSSWCTKYYGCLAVGTTTVDTPATMKPTTSYPTRQAINECGDTCYPSSMPTGTNLSNCILTFTGLVPDTWYAAAIQVKTRPFTLIILLF